MLPCSRSRRQSRSSPVRNPPKTEPGEQIVSNACTTCHDLRPIETQALDEAGWAKEVKANVDRGAKVSADDVPILVAYLVKRYGPLPDGPGKEVLLNVCTRCHDLQRVRSERLTPEGWLEILEAMLNEGAPLTDKDLPDLLRYSRDTSARRDELIPSRSVLTS